MSIGMKTTAEEIIGATGDRYEKASGKRQSKIVISMISLTTF